MIYILLTFIISIVVYEVTRQHLEQVLSKMVLNKSPITALHNLLSMSDMEVKLIDLGSYIVPLGLQKRGARWLLTGGRMMKLRTTALEFYGRTLYIKCEVLSDQAAPGLSHRADTEYGFRTPDSRRLYFKIKDVAECWIPIAVLPHPIDLEPLSKVAVGRIIHFVKR